MEYLRITGVVGLDGHLVDESIDRADRRLRFTPAKEFRAMDVPSGRPGYFTELDLLEPPWRGCHAGLLTVGIMSDGKGERLLNDAG